MRSLSMLLGRSRTAGFCFSISCNRRVFHEQVSRLSKAAAAGTAFTRAAVAAASLANCSRESTDTVPHQVTQGKLSGHAFGVLLPPVPPGMGAATVPPPLNLQDTLEAVAIPPTGRNMGPRVEHIRVAAPGLLSEAVATALQLPHWFVLELIRFGAVHYCPVMVQPSEKAAPRMSPEHLQHMQQLRAAGIAKHGKNPKLQVPRRVTADCQVDEGGYIRVHVHPKRFPASYAVDWAQRVLVNRQEYVVVDKPAGVQVPPTVDNVLETVVACTAVALGLPPDSLNNTHRLDVGTSGVVVLSKGPGFAAWFCKLLANKPDALVKTYRCLTAAAPPLGPMVHWVVVKQRQAGEPAHTRVLLECGAAQQGSGSSGGDDSSSSSRNKGGALPEGAVRCELIVEQVCEVFLTGGAASEWGPTAYETTLQLVTGRTHQIRAQMAAVGCPLLGDQLYTALGARWQHQQQQQQGQELQAQQQHHEQEQQQHDVHVQQPQVQCQQVQPHREPHASPGQCADESTRCPGDESSSSRDRHWGAEWSKVYQEDPSRPIGLQAAKLRVRNVDGRMTQDEADWGSGGGSAAEVQQGGGGQGGRDHPEWVEFEAGTPWWRA